MLYTSNVVVVSTKVFLTKTKLLPKYYFYLGNRCPEPAKFVPRSDLSSETDIGAVLHHDAVF